MNGNSIALDTNRVIRVLNNQTGAGEWIQQYANVLLPVPVVAELLFGAANSRNSEANTERVRQLVARCTVIEITLSTASVYASVRLKLKQRGRPIPENDVWIASLCIEHGVALATDDEHFEAVDDLAVVR